jgi:hypothetical protein
MHLFSTITVYTEESIIMQGKHSLNCSIKKANNLGADFSMNVLICGLDSVVSIATGYGLDGPGIESW